MSFFLFKTIVTACMIAIVSELSRRFVLLSALLISLPLMSILTFIWVYIESRDPQKIITMSYEIFWLVFPSLTFFLILPFLLKLGVHFGWAMLLTCLGMSVLYTIAVWVIKLAG